MFFFSYHTILPNLGDLFSMTSTSGETTAVRGALIVLEGLDRSGKTTQVQLLEKRFLDLGRNVKVMRFPGRFLFFSFFFSWLVPFDAPSS